MGPIDLLTGFLKQLGLLVVGAPEHWGYHGGLVDDLALVITELAANVVVHAGSSFTV